MKTSILYIDDHPDTMDMPLHTYTYHSVYPVFPVEGLRISHVKDIRRTRSNKRGVKVGGKYVGLRSYPADWRSRQEEICPGRNGKPYWLDLTPVIEDMGKSEMVQFHIDPDAFTKGDIKKYFFSDACVCSKGHCDANESFKLVRTVKPDFVGFFQFYLSKIPEEYWGRLLANLKAKTAPDAKYILVNRYNIDRMPGSILAGAEVLPIDIVTEGESIPSRRDFLRWPAWAELEGEKFDLSKLTADGQAFGVFESHADAHFFFDSGVEEPATEAQKREDSYYSIF